MPKANINSVKDETEEVSIVLGDFDITFPESGR